MKAKVPHTGQGAILSFPLWRNKEQGGLEQAGPTQEARASPGSILSYHRRKASLHVFWEGVALFCVCTVSSQTRPWHCLSCTATVSRMTWWGWDLTHATHWHVMRFSQLINICFKLTIPPPKPVQLRITYSHLTAECDWDVHQKKLRAGKCARSLGLLPFMRENMLVAFLF